MEQRSPSRDSDEKDPVSQKIKSTRLGNGKKPSRLQYTIHFFSTCPFFFLLIQEELLGTSKERSKNQGHNRTSGSKSRTLAMIESIYFVIDLCADLPVVERVLREEN